MAKEVFFRSGYNYDADEVSQSTGLLIDSRVEENARTKQSFKDECDINELVRRFGLTGEMPQTLEMPKSGDFGTMDFHEAMNAVRQAEEQFMTLPAEMRARFGHDPGALIAFLEDEKNKDEAIKLGLVNPPVEKTRDVVMVVDELAAKIVGKEQ